MKPVVFVPRRPHGTAESALDGMAVDNLPDLEYLFPERDATMDESGSHEDNVIDLRRHPRFRMSRPVVLSFARIELSVSFRGDHQGEGTVADLSANGCKVHSPATVQTGDRLSLTLDIPRSGMRVKIDSAYVRWVEQGAFGLEWAARDPDLERTLQWLIKTQS